MVSGSIDCSVAVGLHWRIDALQQGDQLGWGTWQFVTLGLAPK